MEVEHAFFHCAKAYLRSQLWQPETWPAEAYHVRFGPYFHSSEARSEALDTAVNQQCRSLDRRPLRTGGRETTARLLFRLWARLHTLEHSISCPATIEGARSAPSRRPAASIFERIQALPRRREGGRGRAHGARVTGPQPARVSRSKRARLLLLCASQKLHLSSLVETT